jgi:hypothetical protein
MPHRRCPSNNTIASGWMSINPKQCTMLAVVGKHKKTTKVTTQQPTVTPGCLWYPFPASFDGCNSLF